MDYIAYWYIPLGRVALVHYFFNPTLLLYIRMSEPKRLKNGELVTGMLSSYCDLCGYSFGGSTSACPARYLNGKFYHPEKCYLEAAQIYLVEKQIELLETTAPPSQEGK